MKYFIISDIHGSEGALKIALEAFRESKSDYLIILGDILYHGPRNPLPESHNPKGVVELLNPLADKIIACRGNCDAEVDQMLLSFPVLSDYALIADNGTRLFCTHGHIYNPENLPHLSGTDLFLFGHTHIQELYKAEGKPAICNPGSISLPKANSAAGYAIYENRSITTYNLAGKIIARLTV
ncbi:MAG: phosphodiesterase [Spirochaetaceae bacterium]|nr:phosphodiesterase [Spirochaetaceae bacterium]